MIQWTKSASVHPLNVLLVVVSSCVLPDVETVPVGDETSHVGAPFAETSGTSDSQMGMGAPVQRESPDASVGGDEAATQRAGASGTRGAAAGSVGAAEMSDSSSGGRAGNDRPSGSTPVTGGGGGGGTSAGAAGSSTVAAGSAAMDPEPPDTGTTWCGPAADTVDSAVGPGPWMPAHVESTGPSSKSWVFYPMGFGRDGMKHPVFDWGPGSGTGPAEYADQLNHLASHGFVVISQASTESGTTALNWLLAQNESAGSMWYQKLDLTRVGQGGHSMGSLLTLNEADDARLSLYVLVCGGAGGGGGAASINDPVIFLGGAGLGDTTNFEPDYAEVTGPAVFVRHTNTDHIGCARANLAPWVAFMRWHWCGEASKYKPMFGAGGAFCSSPWHACESKNL
jgi:hypothetical protein